MKAIMLTIMVFGFSFLAFPDVAKELEIYWTDAPPVVDGVMDDECWGNAVVVTDFVWFKQPGKKAAEQTEVRVCYDADNLYLFYILYDSRMDKLNYGPPEDARDMLNFNGDVAELFLDPGKTRKAYYQFCASPMGTRFDMSSRKGTRFDPEWQIQPGIKDTHWRLEIRIPFSELVHDGEFLGTPQKGEEWGIQFCRDQASRHEWTQWAPTQHGFHQPDMFGTARFMGRKSGAELPRIKRMDTDDLYFGSAELKLKVESNQPLSGTGYALFLQGKEPEWKEARSEGADITVPCVITEGGSWTLLVRAQAHGKLVYSACMRARLLPVRELVEQVQAAIAETAVHLKGFDHPVKEELRAQLDTLGKSADVLQTRMAMGNITREQWREIEKDAESLEKKWQQKRFDVHLIPLYAKAGSSRAFMLGTAGAQEKVYPDTLYLGGEKPVRLTAAGNEHESFQLLIIPFWQELKDVAVSFSDLKGPSVIPASSCRYSIVDYVAIENYDPDRTGMREREPDILWPGKPFNVSKGSLQPLFIDIHVPPRTQPGAYAGEVRVTAAGQTAVQEIGVQVHPFDLPGVNTLSVDTWFGPAYCWARFYGGKHHADINYTLDMYEKNAAVLSRYRYAAFPTDWMHMWQHITIYREKDGRFTFDFSTWEKYIRIGLKYGANHYSASHSCNLAALTPFSQSGRAVINRETGEKETLGKYISGWLEKQKTGEAYWDSNPVYRDYLTEYVAFMKRIGILEMSHWEIYDEPNDNSTWLAMIRHNRFLRRHVPDLPILNYGVDPTQRKAEKMCLGLIDIWAPGLRHAVDEHVHVLNAMQERREEFGEKFYFYTCGSAEKKQVGYTPYIRYDQSYLGPRMHPWFAWKLKSDGMLIFALNSVPESNIVKDPEKQRRWPESEWRSGSWECGCGTLVYPGPDHELIPSMRLASVRDGLEDYEYLIQLKKRLAYIDPQEQAELFRRMEKELEIDPEIIEDVFRWAKETSVIDNKRMRLAKLIAEADKVIAETYD
ncbi:MAG: DUF4091 domain-containing protein [Victivallales bacterium]|nr:DUF4091 domain-containing protein [Victivallales bacterium]